MFCPSQCIDVLVLAKTCLGTGTDEFTKNELDSPGYELNHIPLNGVRCGCEIDIVYKSSLVVTVINQRYRRYITILNT